MSSNSRTWIFIGLIGLIVIGGVLIALPLFMSAVNAIGSTPVPADLNTDQTVPFPAVPRLAVDKALAAYEAKQAVFVDARTTGQYEAGHIPGAKSIPVNDLESRLKELNPEQWIITYCT